MKKQKNQLNEVAIFDDVNYQIGLGKLNSNLENFLDLENSFERITGSKEIKSLEYLNTFITELSGFPNLEASIKLLDFETSYLTIQNTINIIDYTLIDLVNKTVCNDVLQAYKEERTTRLSDNAQANYLILLQIAKLYEQVTNPDFLRSINSPDFRITWNVNLLALNQMDIDEQRGYNEK